VWLGALYPSSYEMRCRDNAISAHPLIPGISKQANPGKRLRETVTQRGRTAESAGFHSQSHRYVLVCPSSRERPLGLVAESALSGEQAGYIHTVEFHWVVLQIRFVSVRFQNLETMIVLEMVVAHTFTTQLNGGLRKMALR
jgi:hypothetical protein